MDIRDSQIDQRLQISRAVKRDIVERLQVLF